MTKRKGKTNKRTCCSGLYESTESLLCVCICTSARARSLLYAYESKRSNSICVCVDKLWRMQDSHGERESHARVHTRIISGKDLRLSTRAAGLGFRESSRACVCVPRARASLVSIRYILCTGTRGLCLYLSTCIQRTRHICLFSSCFSLKYVKIRDMCVTTTTTTTHSPTFLS